MAADAEKTFQRILTRAITRGDGDASNHLRTELDLVEVRLRFNLEPAATLVAQVEKMTDEVSKNVSPANQRFRQLLLRAAIACLSVNRVDLATKYTELAQAKGTDKSASNAARLETTLAAIDRAKRDYGPSLDHLQRRLQMYKSSGERVSLRYAYSQMDEAYALALQAGVDAANLAQQALNRAKASLPTTLPANHRVFRQWDYVTAYVHHGAQSTEVKRAREALALHFGRSEAELPEVLLGVFVQP